MYSIPMHPVSPPYRCRLCGAASYRKLTHRSDDGAMQYSGLYRCSGCSVTFSDPTAWREGGDAEIAAADVSRVHHVAAEARPSFAASDAGHNFATGHMAVPRMPGEPIGYGRSESDLKEIREAAERANTSKGRRRYAAAVSAFGKGYLLAHQHARAPMSTVTAQRPV